MGKRRPFNRTDRLGSQIKEVLAVALLRDTREEILHRIVVTDVEVTRDLSLARVYYQVMNGDPEEVKDALERASGFLRSRVGKQVRARHTPELRFYHDDTLEKGLRVEKILSSLDIRPAEEMVED